MSKDDTEKSECFYRTTNFLGCFPEIFALKRLLDKVALNCISAQSLV